jgi:hypothetical protein
LKREVPGEPQSSGDGNGWRYANRVDYDADAASLMLTIGAVPAFTSVPPER